MQLTNGGKMGKKKKPALVETGQFEVVAFTLERCDNIDSVKAERTTTTKQADHYRVDDNKSFNLINAEDCDTKESIILDFNFKNGAGCRVIIEDGLVACAGVGGPNRCDFEGEYWREAILYASGNSTDPWDLDS